MARHSIVIMTIQASASMHTVALRSDIHTTSDATACPLLEGHSRINRGSQDKNGANQCRLFMTQKRLSKG